MANKIKNPVERLPEHIYGLEGDYSIIPNPFTPLLPLVLLVLSLTIMLLVDEIRHKPELSTLEACHLLALIEGQKEKQKEEEIKCVI